MDDLDALRAYNAHFLQPDQAAEERAWRRLTQQMEDRSGASQRARWRVAVAVAACMALVLVAVGLLLPGGRGGPAPAQATFRSLAQRSQTQAPLAIPVDGWVREEEEQFAMSSHESVVTGSHFEFEVASTRTTWRAADGSATRVIEYGEPSFVDAQDRAEWEEWGSPELVPAEPEVETFEPGTFEVLDLSSLPTDVTRLRSLIERRELVEAPLGVLGTFSIVGELLSDQLAPPEVRAALFGVAATLPGVEGLGELDDPLGRPGVGVELRDGDRSTTLIFDPTTSLLLAQVDRGIYDGHEIEGWNAHRSATVTNTPPPRRGASG